MPKNTVPRSRRASAPKKPYAKPAVKPDFIAQTELRSIVELQNMAADLAVEIRRRIVNGARVQKGDHTAHVNSFTSIALSRRHRQGVVSTSLCGLHIVHPEATNA